MSESEPPGSQPALRIGNRERDATLDVLNEAFAHGRLTPDELDERSTAALAARTEADLAQLVADLPSGGHPAVPARSLPALPADVHVSKTMVAVMSGVSRRGPWRPGNRARTIAVMGGADLDFRQAVTTESVLVLTAVAVMGGIDIIVPEDWTVSMSGFALMGGRDITTYSEPTVPRVHLHIRGWALMGGIDVKQKPRDR
jgi:hypothetical protein